MIRGHTPVTDNVFDHDDGVVDQDTDGEDQCEEGDAVQCVAVQIEDSQRERERHRNRGEDNQRFAEAERESDQDADRDHGDQHVPQQFVRFFLGRVAVVAGDGHLHVRRDYAAAQGFQAMEDILADADRVGSFAFGDGNRYGWEETFAVGKTDVLQGLFAAVGDLGYIVDENRLLIGDTGDHVANIVGGAEELAGFQKILPVAAGERARRHPSIGQAEGSGDLQWRKVVRIQAGRIESDLNFAALAADQRHGRDIRRLLDRIIHLRGDAAQLDVAVALAPKGERQDRHIVNRARLDERERCAGRNQIKIRVQLLIQADDAFLFVLPDQETHDGSGHAGTGGGVYILDAGDFPEEFFHRLGDALLHFASGGAGHLDENIDHRHDDLRLLFTRQFPDGEGAEQHGAGDDERRELRPDPDAGEVSG